MGLRGHSPSHEGNLQATWPCLSPSAKAWGSRCTPYGALCELCVEVSGRCGIVCMGLPPLCFSGHFENLSRLPSPGDVHTQRVCSFQGSVDPQPICGPNLSKNLLSSSFPWFHGEGKGGRGDVFCFVIDPQSKQMHRAGPAASTQSGFGLSPPAPRLPEHLPRTPRMLSEERTRMSLTLIISELR